MHKSSKFGESKGVTMAAEATVKLYEAFLKFDVDGSNSVNAAELKAILQRKTTGTSMSDEDVQAIIEAFDKNGDGELQIKEFINAMTAQSQQPPSQPIAISTIPAAGGFDALQTVLDKHRLTLRLIVGVDFSKVGNQCFDGSAFRSLHQPTSGVQSRYALVISAFAAALTPYEPLIHAVGWGGRFPRSDGEGASVRSECWPLVGTDEKHCVADAHALLAAYAATVDAAELSFPNTMRPTLEYVGGTACGDIVKFAENRQRWEEQRRPFTVGLLLTGGKVEDVEMAQDGVHGLSEHHKPASVVTVYCGPAGDGHGGSKGGAKELQWAGQERVRSSAGRGCERAVSQLFELPAEGDSAACSAAAAEMARTALAALARQIAAFAKDAKL